MVSAPWLERKDCRLFVTLMVNVVAIEVRVSAAERPRYVLPAEGKLS